MNLDDGFIPEMDTIANPITYSFTELADFTGNFSNTGNGTHLMINNTELHLPYGGKIMAQNALAAFTVASTLGLSDSIIKNRIESFRAPPGRFEVLNMGDHTVINDCYNANLSSVISGLEAFVEISQKNLSFFNLSLKMELRL